MRRQLVSSDTLHPFGFCPSCGPFWATGFGLGTGSTVIGCSTDCPDCGKIVEVVSGTYEGDRSHLSLLLDPSVSREAVRALRAIAAAANRGEISPKRAQEMAEQVKPGWGVFFDPRRWSESTRAAALSGLLSATGAILGSMTSSSPDVHVYNTTVVQQVSGSDLPSKRQPAQEAVRPEFSTSTALPEGVAPIAPPLTFGARMNGSTAIGAITRFFPARQL